MPRRKPYSKVKKRGQERPAHVRGQGDVVYKIFQCLAPDCQAWAVVHRADIGPGFQIACAACGHELHSGGATRFFQYDLLVDEAAVESGDFAIDHSAYVNEAPDYKYCLLCYALKPLDAFGHHASRVSGRQGECQSCKTAYNGIKNKTRIPEQHREASERRRLLGLLSGDTTRVDREAIRRKFDQRCFACDAAIEENAEALDHTLPARLLWPLETATATLLCTTCNGQKGGLWPSTFYDDKKLRRLAVLTGIPFDVLMGEPAVNDEALTIVRQDPDSFLAEWIHRPEELKVLRRRVREVAGVDIFENATSVPKYLD